MTGRRFYADDGTLDRMLDDPDTPLPAVLDEIDRLARRDEHAAAYYRDNPRFLFPAHPWLAYVATGRAAYLGWEPPPARIPDHRSGRIPRPVRVAVVVVLVVLGILGHLAGLLT